MNLGKKAVEDLIQGIKNSLDKVQSKSEMLVFPSSVHLGMVSDAFRNTKVRVGAQNIYPSKLAAFTGEISPEQLKDFGIEDVLVGHSERRQFLNENDEFLNKKIHHILEEGLKPMLCIGETLSEREANKTFEIVKEQLIGGLSGVSKDKVLKITIAYEPVWAIGTGKVATPEQAEEVHAFIRKELKNLYDESTSESMSILYGGSVKPDNIKALLEKPNIDGGLVGGASQKADSYLGLFP